MPIPSSSTSTKDATATPRGNKSGSKRTFGFGFLPFSCGCRGSKAASASSPSRTTTPTTTSSSSSSSSTSTTTSSSPTGRQPGSESLTTTTAASLPSPSHYPTLLLKQQPAEDDDGHSTPAGTPTVTDLLRQLSDLEQAVMALDTTKPAVPALPDPAGHRHNHQELCPESSASVGRSMSFAAEPRAPRRVYRRSRSYGEGRGRGGGAASLVAAGTGSVAVETETADPVGDFRRSMMEVMAQEGITSSGEEVEDRLRGLLRRFLAINHPSNHQYVVRAFALVLEEVCASSSPPPSSCSPTNTWVDATAPTFSADLRQRPPVRRRGCS